MLMRVKLQLLLASNAFLQKKNKKHKHNVIYMYPYIIAFLHIIL